MTVEALGKLGRSIFSNDIYILIAAGIEGGLLFGSWLSARSIIVKFNKND